MYTLLGLLTEECPQLMEKATVPRHEAQLVYALEHVAAHMLPEKSATSHWLLGIYIRSCPYASRQWFTNVNAISSPAGSSLPV